VANCSNCSAPLPSGSISCDYCGSRNDIDLRGVHYYTTHGADSARTCPRCRIPLKTIDLKLDGRFLIERCDDCLGLFFDPGELEALLAATVGNVHVINERQLAAINIGKRTRDYGVTYIKCPACDNLMNRVNFGTKSGVVVDRCKEHGVWLDGGELRHLCEWMKSGGKLLDQQRLEERQQAEALAQRERRSSDGQSAGSESPGLADYDSTLSHYDLDLFEIVVSAVRFIMR
jgi:Zn-finger nucleic acid-binding protein